MNSALLTLLLGVSATCASALEARMQDAAAAEPYVAIRVSKALTMRGAPVDHATILVRAGKIVAVGSEVEVPDGARVLDYREAWACPGFIDLHAHIWGGDTNEMGHPLNPELRTLDAIVPWNPNIQRANAAGVTTILAISGSGTNFSSFGTLMKLKPVERLEDAIVLQPGAMKVAQDYNPERNGGDLGNSRMGMGWHMRWMNDRAKEYAAARRRDPSLREPALDSLADLHERKVPVLIHTAGARGVLDTIRMWDVEYGTRMVVSHGSFDGWRAAPYAASRDIAINNGPRMFEFSRVDARFHGLCAENSRAGVRRLSVNTDSPVVPQEDLFFQATMAAWLGLEDYDALEALTYWPAEALGVEDRLGSLAPGMDADIVITRGSPIDVRSSVLLVIVDGEIVFDLGNDSRRL